ncbi:MAG: hypothetical protein COA69_01685 [Robiginitomaculum sp.]|nr:MAG: hypothetical protein COA69_01685 [Robiginitomaculum sp.]
MSGQYIAAAIMFFITVGVTALFWLPASKIKQKCKIVNFYWVGVWVFLCGLVALSGAQSVLIILGQDVQRFANAILVGVSASFVAFVMFAWGRLTLHGLTSLAIKVK